MRDLWPAITDHVRASGGEMLSTILEGARPLRVDPERSILHLGFPADARFHKRKAESKGCVELLSESVEAISGQRLHPKFELVEGQQGTGAGAGASPEMADDEIIELLKTKFDAREVFEDPPGEGEAQSREAG